MPFPAISAGVAYTNKIGTTGPGGGIIFYDAGAPQSWGQYIEVVDISTPSTIKYWMGANSTNFFTGTSLDLGTSITNTTAIIANLGNTNNPSYLTRQYRGGGFTDWSLPSLGDLTALYYARAYVPTLNTTVITPYYASQYWSSSSDSGSPTIRTGNAWQIPFASASYAPAPVAWAKGGSQLQYCAVRYSS